MESVSLKLEPSFLKRIEKLIKRNGYSTKTEFIRDAMRDKMNELEKEERLNELNSLLGSSKHKTKIKDLDKAREKAFEEIAKKIG